MIKTELDFVYITKDGRRFLDRDEAVKHEDTLIDHKELVFKLMSKLKGE